jgi:glyoxylase-like metal-dependent hydrolase (beta-lactamase superfamily II)
MDPQVRALPQCGAEFLIGELDIDTAGYNSLPNDVWEDPDEWLEDGDIVRLESRELRVMHTPGHTIGHVTFHDAEAGLLFSGDHVLPRITPSIGFEPVAAELPLADFLNSLALTAAAPDAATHGPVTESPPRAQAGAHRRPGSGGRAGPCPRWPRLCGGLAGNENSSPWTRSTGCLPSWRPRRTWTSSCTAARWTAVSKGDCCGIRRTQCPAHRGKPMRLPGAVDQRTNGAR